MTIATGGVWTQERLHEAGKAAEATCKLCGEGREDELHMFWQCSWLEASEHPEIKCSQHLRPKAEVGASDFPCWYMRGITPRDWTWREPIIPEICPTRDIESPSRVDSNVPIFLDGSGGIHSSDKRIRSCGWAWELGLRYGASISGNRLHSRSWRSRDNLSRGCWCCPIDVGDNLSSWEVCCHSLISYLSG